MSESDIVYLALGVWLLVAIVAGLIIGPWLNRKNRK
jgi:uncharacterized protein YneF (UPF0154 family)